MAKRKKKELIEETNIVHPNEYTIPYSLIALNYKADQFIFEPYLQRAEKMVKRYYPVITKKDFYVMKEQIIDDNFIDSVLVIDEFWIDVSSIRELKNEFIVLISDSKFIKKFNHTDRKEFTILADYKLLFSLPNTYLDTPIVLYVLRKIYKTLN